MNAVTRLIRRLVRTRSKFLTVLFFIGLAGLVLYSRSTQPRLAQQTSPSPGQTQVTYLPDTPNGATTPVTPRAPEATFAIPTVPPDIGAVPTVGPEDLASSSPSATREPYHVYLPVVGNGAAPTPTPTSQPSPTVTPAPAQIASVSTPPPTSAPAATRGPIRITKLGLGVYDSGGAMLPILDQSRPSVILLQDPAADFAREVRKRFPRAFIVGRVFTADQPLDNPAQRGRAFADRVAAAAVPLKGVVDAWVSYNEVASSSDPGKLASYCTFQVAFAHHLQDDYGIAAVAANDGPRTVTAEDYVKYCADAIRTSKYFGFHDYPNPEVTSLRDPRAADQVFYYRRINDALLAAGISHGPFIATEVGLYNGFRGVESDTAMARDFVWLADQMNQDPYVLGGCVYGLFVPGRWPGFNVDGSGIPQIMGDYNTQH